MIKKCKKCKTEKSVSDFSKRINGQFNCYCKECSNNIAKLAYSKNKNKTIPW